MQLKLLPFWFSFGEKSIFLRCGAQTVY